MKRILLTNFHPHQGGGGGHARYILTILQSALRNEFELGVAAPEGSAVWSAGRALGAPTFACAFPGHVKEIPQMIGAVRRFERIAREWTPDLVHMNGSRDQSIVVLWKTLYGRGVPCVRTHHAVRNIPDNAYNRWAYRKVIQGHVYVSHSAKNISWAGDSLKPPNACVIPNGIDVKFWTPMAKDPASAAQFGVAPTDFVFGSHAGMGAHKRTDLFLRAAALQLRRGAARPFRILLRGNEQEVRQSRRLAEELGLQNVFYVQHAPDPRGKRHRFDRFAQQKSHVDERQVAARIRRVLHVEHVLQAQLLREPPALAHLLLVAARELMAMGKPLLSTNYAGLVENVDDELNGRLVECGDVEGVAEAIGWFLELAPAALAELSRNARLKAERVFNAEHQIRGLRRFYRASLGLSTSSV